VDTLYTGGAEFLMVDFAQVAAGAGIDLSIAALKPLTPSAAAAERLRRHGFEPQAVPVTSLIHPRELRRVRAHLASVRPDIVHTHLSTADFLGGVAARTLGIPSVSTIHADWWPRGRADRVRTWLASKARRHCAEAVVAVSDSARTVYLADGHDVPEHVSVVRNGILDRARPGSGRRAREGLGIRHDELVLTTLSELRPEKNLEAAVDAVERLRGRFPNLRLLIVGDGPSEQAIRQDAARLGEAAVLTGHREDVMELLDATDVLVHPSRFDAFPTTLLEAMAASVPIVATEVGGIPEIVLRDETGVLVAPPPTGEAFAAATGPLLDDASRRDRLGRAGRRRFEVEFSAESWARRLRAVYDKVLSEPRARA
jgi:glycosyltransferase involved in cell wall biosynthesis